MKLIPHGLVVLCFLMGGIFARSAEFVVPEDWLAFSVNKAQTFVQTNQEPPVANTFQAYTYLASVRGEGSVIPFAAMVTPPEQAQHFNCTLETQSIGGYILLSCLEFGDLAEDFDLIFPEGTYVADISYGVTNGTEIVTNNASMSISLTGDAYPHLVPTFTNFPESHVLPAGQDLVFAWQPWLEGGFSDVVGFEILELDPATETAEVVFEQGTQAILAGSEAIVPGHVLEPNRNYQAHLIFDRESASKYALGGDILVVGRSSYARDTFWSFATTPGPVGRPVLRVIARPTALDNRFALSFSATPGELMELQVTSNFVVWTTLVSTNAATSEVVFSEEVVAGQPERFFRVIQP